MAVADTKKQRPPACYSKAYDKEKVKSEKPGVNLAVDPDAPVTYLQFRFLSSKMGQIMKAMEKLIEIQMQAFQSQPSKKENAQPNRFNQQGLNQQSGSGQGSGKRKDSEHHFALKGFIHQD